MMTMTDDAQNDNDKMMIDDANDDDAKLMTGNMYRRTHM